MNKGMLVLLYIAAEIYSIILVSDYIGGFNTLGLLILAVGIGSWRIGVQKRSVFSSQQETVLSTAPEQVLCENMLIFLSGVLFIIPGFVSDIFALALTIPPVRSLCVARLLSYMKSKGADIGNTAWGNGHFFYFGKTYYNHTPYGDSRSTYQVRVDQNEVIDGTEEHADTTSSHAGKNVIIDVTANPATPQNNVSESDKKQ